MVPDVYCNGLHILEYDGHTILAAAQQQASVTPLNVAVCICQYVTAVKYTGFARPAS
jgi:hypothetical protein